MAYRIVLLNVNRTKKATELFILTYMEEEIWQGVQKCSTYWTRMFWDRFCSSEWM